MTLGTCHYCLKTKPLIDAHIIPNSFFSRIQPKDNPSLLLNATDYPKRRRKGVYDNGILCKECDGEIGDWDTYAQAVLRMDMSGFAEIIEQDQLAGWERPNYNYRKLKLFFVSLVWRASISSEEFYRQINIGRFEDKALTLMKTGDLGDPQAFGVVIARFTEAMGHALLNPHPERINGINHVRFYLAGFIAYIKIDTRPCYIFDRFLLRDSSALCVIRRSVHRGGEAEVINKLLNAPKNKDSKYRQRNT